MPIITYTIPFRRKRERPEPAPASPTGPVLVEATLDNSDGPVLFLTFDRAVEIVGYDGATVNVFDHPNLARFDGAAGAQIVGPQTVRIDLTLQSAVPPGDDVTLDVSAGSGIVAADGGSAWGGVSFVGLPFP